MQTIRLLSFELAKKSGMKYVEDKCQSQRSISKYSLTILSDFFRNFAYKASIAMQNCSKCKMKSSIYISISENLPISFMPLQWSVHPKPKDVKSIYWIIKLCIPQNKTKKKKKIYPLLVLLDHCICNKSQTTSFPNQREKTYYPIQAWMFAWHAESLLLCQSSISRKQGKLENT